MCRFFIQVDIIFFLKVALIDSCSNGSFEILCFLWSCVVRTRSCTLHTCAKLNNCNKLDGHLYFISCWWLDNSLYRILRMITSTIQSFSLWQSEWHEQILRSSHSLCQFLNHIHHNTTSVLFLIHGCMQRLSTLSHSII